jgi:DNA-directed RNA polymerase subunit RPC12/RpoP
MGGADMSRLKEFIEKLIGRLEEYQENNTQCKSSDDYELGQFNACEYAIKIVNQLAEEYNNDVCEWEKVKNGNAYKCNTHAEIHDSRVLDWFVCPYCGKKIKVVE